METLGRSSVEDPAELHLLTSWEQDRGRVREARLLSVVERQHGHEKAQSFGAQARRQAGRKTEAPHDRTTARAQRFGSVLTHVERTDGGAADGLAAAGQGDGPPG